MIVEPVAADTFPSRIGWRGDSPRQRAARERQPIDALCAFPI
jgi:hypothetical protein